MTDRISERLLDGEELLHEVGTTGGVLVLTNQRVRFDGWVSGRDNYMSILLRSVASCGLVTRSYPLLLVAALIAGPLMLMATAETFVGIIVSLLLVGSYFLSRTSTLKVSSHGGEAIVVPFQRMGRTEMIDLLDMIDRERVSNRMRQGQE